jgi:hypothetical protein
MIGKLEKALPVAMGDLCSLIQEYGHGIDGEYDRSFTIGANPMRHRLIAVGKYVCVLETNIYIIPACDLSAVVTVYDLCGIELYKKRLGINIYDYSIACSGDMLFVYEHDKITMYQMNKTQLTPTNIWSVYLPDGGVITSITATDGFVYIKDVGVNCIHIYRYDGKLLSSIHVGHRDYEYMDIEHMDVYDGKIYAVTSANHVLVFGIDGAFQYKWNVNTSPVLSNQIRYTYDIAAYGGKVFLSTNHSIAAFTTSGTHLRTWRRKDVTSLAISKGELFALAADHISVYR